MKLFAWLRITSIFRRRIERKPSVLIWIGLIQASAPHLLLFCYISLNPLLHFPFFSLYFPTSLWLNLTLFCSLYPRFFYKVLSFPWLVYCTCAHLLLFPCIRLLFSVSNRLSLDASDTIITYIRVKNADVKFLQTSFVVSSVRQYFECTQLQPWVVDADFDTCQLHFRTSHTSQASVLVDRWWWVCGLDETSVSSFSVDIGNTVRNYMSELKSKKKGR
jgi:hypothetical protein